MTPASRRSVVWRLYALGVVQLVLLAAAVVFVGVLLSSPPPERPGKARALAVEGAAARLAPLVNRPTELAAALEGLRAGYDLELSLYDDGQRLVATNVEPALSLEEGARRGSGSPPWGGAPLWPPGPPGHPPGPPPRPGELFGRLPGPLGGPPGPPPPHPPMLSSFAAGGRTWSLVARERHLMARQSPPPSPLVTFFLTGFVVVGLGALLTRRWITTPLGQLSAAARSLGSGDLNTRAGLARADEFGDVSRAFDEMAERVRALLLAEKELLANVSHELRTPLARIRVALDLASEGDAEAARASLSEIAVDLNELEALVDDILTARRLELADAKVGGGGFALRLERLEASALAERAAARFRARHPERPFEVSVAGGLPEIEADPMLLRRVLDNLLENAHKYSPDLDAPVTLRATARDGAALFEVEDRGVGIAPDDLPHVFTAFFRGDRSRSRGTGGVGLGLTLAKRIVEAHGGEIGVTSAPGAGTKARVAVPAAPA
jgi:signal transduction histidine kinase